MNAVKSPQDETDVMYIPEPCLLETDAYKPFEELCKIGIVILTFRIFSFYFFLLRVVKATTLRESTY